MAEHGLPGAPMDTPNVPQEVAAIRTPVAAVGPTLEQPEVGLSGQIPAPQLKQRALRIGSGSRVKARANVILGAERSSTLYKVRSISTSVCEIFF
jgi:hypothetical protein